jgi:choline dehydrogenase-like flavoprotein
MLGWPDYAAVARGAGYWCIPVAADEERGIVQLIFYLAITDDISGRVGLVSAVPDEPPMIDHGYWEVAESGAFDPVWQALGDLLQTRALREAAACDLDSGAPLRRRLLDGLRTGAHPAGSCGIGAVVSPGLDVLGVERLSIADASVFPVHVTNNPNLMVHVIGEVAAENLLGRPIPSG